MELPITQMPHRLKLIIAYDGAQFAGWQSQAHRNTVQDRLEQAFEKISGYALRVHGAGRTDAGVHAIGQCAHVDVPTDKLTPTCWLVALNALLPPSIRVLRCRPVSKDFHARFSAKGKLYRYRIWRGPILPPWEYRRAWHITSALDLAVLTSAAAALVGRHDFAAFAANRGHRQTDTVRTIHSLMVRQRGPCLTIELDGDGFLYKMARLIVGTLVQCATGQENLSEITEKFGRSDGRKRRFVAPADGLFLVRVRY